MSTIAAIATPAGEGAIALLRLSGPEAIPIAQKIFQGASPLAQLPAGRQTTGHLHDPATGRRLDHVALVLRRAPRSATGEDVVEISTHGGLLLTRRVLDLLLAHGAEPAEPGEFTRRAFLNGKLDLTQAEAVMDLIHARSDLALRAAAEQLDGRLGHEILRLRDLLLDLLAHIEAHIDFPEDDIAPDTSELILSRLRSLRSALAALLRTADQGRILRQGLRTVLCGPPNAGKSSLLNALLGHQRAIVSPVPGTTRDLIEESLVLAGLPLRLADTAGLREAGPDPVEREGMERTRRALAESDLAFLLADASQPPPDNFADLELLVRTVPRRLLLLNKSDLPLHPAWTKRIAPTTGSDYHAVLSISCQTRMGLEELSAAVNQCVTAQPGADWGDAAIAIGARHQRGLQLAENSLAGAETALLARTPPEYVALDLRDALHHLGGIVGQTDTETLLGQIFTQFCIGK